MNRRRARSLAPEALGAGLAFTPEPKPTLGLVLTTTSAFNKTTTICNDSQCARICDKHPTSVISFNPFEVRTHLDFTEEESATRRSEVNSLYKVCPIPAIRLDWLLTQVH